MHPSLERLSERTKKRLRCVIIADMMSTHVVGMRFIIHNLIRHRISQQNINFYNKKEIKHHLTITKQHKEEFYYSHVFY